MPMADSYLGNRIQESELAQSSDADPAADDLEASTQTQCFELTEQATPPTSFLCAIPALPRLGACFCF